MLQSRIIACFEVAVVEKWCSPGFGVHAASRNFRLTTILEIATGQVEHLMRGLAACLILVLAL